MRPKEIFETTNNRSVYNKVKKLIMEKNGKIHCSWCPYHGGENDTNNWYGSKFNNTKKAEDDIKYPSWKLISKNRKQWMDKPKTYKIVEKTTRYRNLPYYEVKF